MAYQNVVVLFNERRRRLLVLFEFNCYLRGIGFVVIELSPVKLELWAFERRFLDGWSVHGASHCGNC